MGAPFRGRMPCPLLKERLKKGNDVGELEDSGFELYPAPGACKDVHRNEEHDLCPRCYRDQMNRLYADMLAQDSKFHALDFAPAAQADARVAAA